MLTARAAALVLCLLSATLAHATSQRTFVASTGVDTNTAFNCSIAKPCRGFAAAIGVTSAKGEVIVLDSAGYGPIASITQSVTINAPTGIYAGISVFSGDGITINAGATDTVVLRGLTLVGGGVGANGVNFISGGKLDIQNTLVSGFTNNGIVLTAGASVVSISDTVVSNNGNDGIVFQPTASATLMVERVQAIGNANNGFLMEGDNAPQTAAVKGAFADCVASGNGRGFFGDGFSNTARPTFTITNCKIANNTDIGIVSSTTTVFLTQSTITNNGSYGFFIQFVGALIESFGSNSITDTTNQGSLTSVLPQ